MLLKTKTEGLKVPTGLWSSPIYELTSEHDEKIKIDVTTSISIGLKPNEVIIKDVIPFFKSKKLESVLDLGAGALRHTIPFLEAGFRVHPVEFKEAFNRRWCLKMLEEAKENPNFSPLMTPNDFLLDISTFDAVLLCNVLQIMPVEKERRILLKYIAEKLPKQAYLLYMGQYTYVKDHLKEEQRVNDGYFIGAKREYKAFYRNFTTEETHALMAEFGFQHVRSLRRYGRDQIFLYEKQEKIEEFSYVKRVYELISWWLGEIKAKNCVNFYYIDKVAEDLALKLLNEIYDLQLVNLNYEESNYPGIDLGDKINKIAFQITSRNDIKMIKKSLEKFVKGQKNIYPNGIRFLILNQEEKPQLSKKKYREIYPGFDTDLHILTAKELMQEIRRIYDTDKERFSRIKMILEKEFTERLSAKTPDEMNDEPIFQHKKDLSDQKNSLVIEKSIVALFQELFSNAEERGMMVLKTLKQQKRGEKSGHDISFEYGIKNKDNLKCNILIKDYSKKIQLKDIAERVILQEEYDSHIDHWILISPRTGVSIELDKLLEHWENTVKYSFKIQVWTPETKVDEFFGLIPDIYDQFYKPSKGELHPRDWSEEKRISVKKYWMEKLKPPLRLPEAWKSYVKNPMFLCLKNEKSIELDKIFQNHVTLRCKNKKGRLLGKSLEENVRDWMESSQKPFLLLLGLFGDGKTFFTYLLARKLAEEFLTDPHGGWIPIRFALEDFEGNDSPEVFIRERLEEFRADKESFINLRNKYRFLILLDGFDEMFVKLDTDTFKSNINDLKELCRYFKGLKILITSRPHFFENKDMQNQFLKEFESPIILHLAPIDRDTRIEYFKAEITERKIRELIGKKNNNAYLEARSKLLTLKERHPKLSESLKFELNFLFNLDSRPDDDIHEEFLRKFLDDPSHYGALSAQKVERGWIGIAMPDESFITIPEIVFNLISKRAVIQLNQLEAQERIKERTIKVEHLFKSNLYGFAEDELRKNLDLIERNPEGISEGIKKKNLDILRDYYTVTLSNESIISEDESLEQVLRFRNAINFILEWGEYFAHEEKPGAKTPSPTGEAEKKETETQPTMVDESSTSYDKGEQLERSLFDLFQQLFRLNDSHKIKVRPKELKESVKKKKERYLEQKRWQEAGNQYGYDLEFTWKEVFVSSKSESRQCPEIKCCIECKHYSGGIDPNELFGKLAQMSLNEDNVDHWILVSPHANLTNTAKDILKKTRKNYPFDIHIWTQEYGVEELLGIDPEVFEEFFVLPDKDRMDELKDPRCWTEEYRQTIIDKWLNKLPPKYRLPNGKLLPEKWIDNLKNPEKTLISYAGEDYDNMVGERRIAISDKDRLCLTEEGTVGNLHIEFLKWLEDEDSRVLAVLGEFGSGKSLHSYSLGIETAEMFLRDPISSRIPIRLVLKNCMDSNLQAVLEEQLFNMDTSYEEFSQLNLKEKILFILDGFDEMSRYITHKMTLNRFKMLYRFCDRYKDAKILLTCRTQYFKSAEEEEEILEEFEGGKKYKIKKLCLRKFTEEEISTCIRNRYSESSKDKKPQEIQKKMKSKYDLMGMSSNPLILSMITEILDDIPPDQRNISQTGIYKTYVNKWLEREISKCEITLRSEREKMQEGVKQVMYELAHQIYRKEDFQLSYEELKATLTPDKLEALRIFDKITSFTGEKEEEITEGIKTRSFLVRENDYFRFVHRSIMEYFIAEKLYQEIKEEKNVEYSGAIQLSFEIINFLADLAINRNLKNFLQKLQNIKYPTKKSFCEEGKWLGTNILSVFYTIKRIMNENNQKISCIKEDWSGIVAHSSLLMNADLSKAIFREADVTESHFENAVLEDSDFTNANLTNIVLGETEDIVYSKWGQGPEELPHSIHSDGNLYKWEIPQNTPSIISQIIKQDVIPPYDICFHNSSMELFIGGVLQTEKEKKENKIQSPKLLSIDNTGNFVSYYKNNRIMVFEVRSASKLCTIWQKDVSALYLSPGGKFFAYVVNKKEVYFHHIINSLSGVINLKENSSSVTSIAINQECSDIFVGFENGKIQCYQSNNDANVFALTWCQQIHEKPIRNISLNAVGNQLLSCGADKKIIIIDVKSGEKKQQLQMLLKCNGMKIKNAKGLSAEKRDELISRGAVI